MLRSLPCTELTAAAHTFWLLCKKRLGWRYGREASVELKTCPRLVPYSQLPAEPKRNYLVAVQCLLATLTDLGFRFDKQEGQRRVAGSVCREALQSLDLFAAVYHDAWAVNSALASGPRSRVARRGTYPGCAQAQKIKDHWVFRSVASEKDKATPALRPFYQLDRLMQERNKHLVMKLLGWYVTRMQRHEGVNENSDSCAGGA